MSSLQERIELLEADLTAPVYVYANRREGQFRQWAPLGASVERQTPLRWDGARADPDPLCPPKESR